MTDDQRQAAWAVLVAMAGEYEPLRNLGLVLSQREVDELYDGSTYAALLAKVDEL